MIFTVLSRSPWTLLPLLVLVLSCDTPTVTEDSSLLSGSVMVHNFDADGNALIRFDVDGNPIDAHGGEIRRFGDLYYLYGETYSCGFQWKRHEPVPFCGFRVYSSPNLSDWKDHGLLFDVSRWEPWQSRCHWFTPGCFRPHVVYNEVTRKYVLWVNVYEVPVNYYVLESDSPTGPFIERGAPVLAINTGAPAGEVNNGDQNLFVDDDGSAYLIYTDWRVEHGDLVIEKLTPDYLNGTGQHVRVGSHGSESPSLFKRDGRYYVTASTPPNGGFAVSATSYWTASSPLGKWSSATRISPTSCRGQPFHVSQLPGRNGEDWYLYQSDLWEGPGPAPGDANQATAALYWAPLSFSGDGRIAPIDCHARVGIDPVASAAPSGAAEQWRLVCDIGRSAAGGHRQREIRFTADRSGQLEAVAVNAFQRYEPDGPLTIEVYRKGSQGDVRLASRIVKPKPAEWLDFPEIAWTANRLTIPVNSAVVAGDELSIRLTAALERGCYGLAVRDDLAVDRPHSYTSTSGGDYWISEARRKVRFEVVMKAE